MQIKRLMAIFFATALLAISLAVSASPASAQPNFQDGLVNVAVGDVEFLNDVQVGVAANIVAQACDVVDLDARAAILATIIGIDEGDTKSATFCKVETGKVKVTQNRD